MNSLPNIKVAQPKMAAPQKLKPVRMSVVKNLLMRGKQGKAKPMTGNY